MRVTRPFGRDCNTFLVINASQLLINALIGKVKSED